MPKIFTAVLLIQIYPALVFGQQPVIKHWERECDIGPEKRIEAINDFGDLRVRRSRKGFVPVSAVIQKHPSDEASPQIRIESGHFLRVEVLYSESVSTKKLKNPEVLSYRRVDLTVYIPPGNPLLARTRQGLIEAKGLKSDVDAFSETGNVIVRSGGAVKAFSKRGNITCWFTRAGDFHRSSFQTESGEIKLFISPKADVSVNIETSGFITSDYSMEIVPVGRLRKKNATVLIGSGNQQMPVKSILGDVKIVRVIE